MSRKTSNRRVMTNAARRALRDRVNGARRLRDQIVAVVSRGERWWRYVHEQDLTDVERADIGEALADFMRNQWSGEVERNGNELESMYHAGFYLSAAWMIFSGTEAYDLADVLGKHRVWLHRDWWITDGWGEFHDTFGVQCGECRTYTMADAEPGSDPADATWPEKCVGCNAALPVRHVTKVWGSGDAWRAECSCSWEAPNAAKAERYAKASATRHVKSAAAAELVAAELVAAERVAAELVAA